MKRTLFVALLSTTFGYSSLSSASEVHGNSFALSQGKPDAGLCQFEVDQGKSFFDAASGKLWACGEAGWVYFESRSSLVCDASPKADINQYRAWKKGSYRGGAEVSHNGRLYKARHWVNKEPGKAEAWELIDLYAGGPSQWNKLEQYHSGKDSVVYMGHVYKATGWSKNVNPSKEVLKSGWKRWAWVGEFECPQ